MVLEVLPYAGQVLDHLDPRALQVLRRRNAAALQDLRRVDRTGREDDLAPGADRLDVPAGDGPELHGGNVLALVDDEARDLVLDQEVEVGPVGGDGGVVADAGVGALDGVGVLGSGDPADAVLVAVGAVLERLEAELLEGLPADLLREGLVRIFHVGGEKVCGNVLLMGHW